MFRAPKPCALLPYSAQGCQESWRENRGNSRFEGLQIGKLHVRSTSPGLSRTSPRDGNQRKYRAASVRYELSIGWARLRRHRANAVRWETTHSVKNQFLSVAEVAAWATVRVFFLGAVCERDEAVSGRLPWV